MLKFLIKHNYWFLGTDGGGSPHSFGSLMSQIGLEKQSSFLGGNPSLVMFPFPFSIFFLVNFSCLILFCFVFSFYFHGFFFGSSKVGSKAREIR